MPAPKVLAWSASGVGGGDIQVFERPDHAEVEGLTKIATVAHPSNDGGSCESGWILLSREPGRVLERSDLVGEAGERIMRELAYSVSRIRKDIPTADRIGNLKLHTTTPTSGKLDSYSDFSGGRFRIEIRGLLNYPHLPDKPIHSALEYYRIRLQDQLIKLATEGVYASRRAEVSAVVEQFMTKDLLELQLLKQSAPFTFTHYDISPRNVLVSGSPLSITGLLDCEFAGFFPPEEEFANDAVPNEGDWPNDAYEIYLLELERAGVATPAKSFPERRWREAMLLTKLIEDIAPWFLREGGREAEELERECSKAADSVVECVEILQGWSANS